MMSELLELHGQAMNEFDQRVRAVQVHQWSSPTPCTEWDVHDLVNHLVQEQLWVPHLLEGGTMGEAGDRYEGDQLGEDPVASWEVAARNARLAWLGSGALERTVHLSFGDAPGELYIWQMTFDLAVHAWDLARGIGADDAIPADLPGELLRGVLKQSDDLSSSGLFAPPVPVSEDADDETRLLALVGRRR